MTDVYDHIFQGAHTSFVTLLASEQLLEKERAFFLASKGESPEKQPGLLYTELFNGIVEEAVLFLMVDALSLFELTPVQRRVCATVMDSTVQLTHRAARRIFAKRDIEELSGLADYWRATFRRVETGDVYVSFPVDDGIVRDFERVIQVCRAGDIGSDMNILIDTLDACAEELTESVFLQSLEYVSLGIVRKKMIDIGVDTIRKGRQTILNRVIRQLSSGDVLQLMNHYASGLRQRGET